MNKTTFRKINKHIANALLRTDYSEEVRNFMDALRTLHDIPIDVPKSRTKKPTAVYGVILKNGGPRKIEVVRTIRDNTSYDLHDALKCFEAHRDLIRDADGRLWSSDKEEAERFVKALVDVGAEAEIVPLPV